MNPIHPGKIRLRKIRESDSGRLLRWRNDPVTRKNSFSSKKINLRDHRQWFQKALASQDGVMRMAVRLNGHPLGVIRYDLLGRAGAEVNVNLRPEARGKGWGVCILQKGNHWLKKTGVLRVTAKIKKANLASRKAFLKAGFQFLKSTPHYDLYEAKLKD